MEGPHIRMPGIQDSSKESFSIPNAAGLSNAGASKEVHLGQMLVAQPAGAAPADVVFVRGNGSSNACGEGDDEQESSDDADEGLEVVVDELEDLLPRDDLRRPTPPPPRVTHRSETFTPASNQRCDSALIKQVALNKL
jgi:hypothetical protein